MSDTTARRRAIVEAAHKKWKNKRLALVELRGVVTLRPLTGRWKRVKIEDNHDELLEFDSHPVWQGTSLEEAEKAVK